MTECPPADERRRLLDGDPTDPTVEAFFAHLEECPVCPAGTRPVDRRRSPSLPRSSIGMCGNDCQRPRRRDRSQWPGLTPPARGHTAERNRHPRRDTEPRGLFCSPGGPPTIEGYDLLEVLGRGGMGVVWKARHRQLNRLAAIKMILGGWHHDPAARVRFLIEAEAVAQLDHPHVVGVYEFGAHGDQPFVALEYIGGESSVRETRPRRAVHPTGCGGGGREGGRGNRGRSRQGDHPSRPETGERAADRERRAEGGGFRAGEGGSIGHDGYRRGDGNAELHEP